MHGCMHLILASEVTFHSFVPSIYVTNKYMFKVDVFEAAFAMFFTFSNCFEIFLYLVSF